MEYRPFGKTGIQVSALGFGCMRLPTTDHLPLSANIDEEEAIRMIRRGIDSGINYVDTAYNYHKNNSEIVVGKALQDGYREKVYLATKSPVYSFKAPEDFERVLNHQLEKLQTDHIDFYLLHNLTREYWETAKKFDLIAKMDKAKAEGKIRHMGFSFHDDLDLFKEIVDGCDHWDFCQIQLNYAQTHYQAGLEGLEYAAARGMGVIIMEPLMGGKLAHPSRHIQEAMPDQSRSTVEWALDYLWNRPQVSLLLSGMSTFDQVDETISYAARSSVGMLTPDQVEKLEKAGELFQRQSLVPCTGCSYCMPCPFGLDIPKIYELYNQTGIDGVKKAAPAYEELKVKADSCKACGACEKICPQHITSTTLMPAIHKVFDDFAKEQAAQ